MSAPAVAPGASVDAVREAIDLALAELKRAGVAGEVAAARSESWSAQVRLGELETVQSAVTRGLRITAYASGNRHASTTTSDTDPAAVRRAVATAVELAGYADDDPWAGLPPLAETGIAAVDLGGDDPAYARLDRDAFVARVVSAEKTALGSDPRVTNSHRSSASASRGRHWYASTDGVLVERVGTRFGDSVVVVARDAAGERQTGGFGTRARRLDALKPADAVGREAGHRAVRGFGWRSVPSGRFPVLFDREVASELLDTLASAVSGGAVYRGSTFLAKALGTVIASPVVTVVDDPLIPEALGSRPCDGEGVRARRLTVVEQGRLGTFLVAAYSARRLHHPLTGHDGGSSNLLLLPGTATRDDLLRELGTGLLVTDLQGMGVDLASGTWSKGASGFWVEGGQVQFPVQEVTLAGNLREMLAGIRTVGDDPLDESSTSSPSLVIDGLTIGGKG